MKLFLSIIVGAVALLVTGCASWDKNLPLVNAQRFEYTRTNPAGIGGSHIVVENLRVSASEVAADSIIATTSIPFVGSVTVTVTDYRRDRVPPTTAPP